MATTTVKSVLEIMDGKGHTEIKWDADREGEVSAARAHFDALRAKGYAAFRMDRGGKEGEHITRFDPNAERILMKPPSVGG